MSVSLQDPPLCLCLGSPVRSEGHAAGHERLCTAPLLVFNTRRSYKEVSSR